MRSGCIPDEERRYCKWCRHPLCELAATMLKSSATLKLLADGAGTATVGSMGCSRFGRYGWAFGGLVEKLHNEVEFGFVQSGVATQCTLTLR